MKPVWLIKMGLNGTYNRIRGGKHLSDIFPVKIGLKQGDAISPLLFKFTLGYAIMSFQVNQEGMILNGTRQLLVYADDVIILGGSVHTVEENAESLVVASTEIGLEENTDKTKYMVMSGDQNARRSHSIKTDNSSFERVK